MPQLLLNGTQHFKYIEVLGQCLKALQIFVLKKSGEQLGVAIV